MNWLESNHYALNLAITIMQRLDEPRGFGSRTGIPGYSVRGRWALRAHKLQQQLAVPLEFVIDEAWMSHPPGVRTTAAFIRRELDWHYMRDGWLCIGLNDEWKDEFAEQARQAGTTPEELMDMAASWALASTDSLISRHLIAARYGITDWRKEWAQWAHFEEGRAEYRRTRKNRKP